MEGERKMESEQMEYLYIMQNGKCKEYKIGITNNLNRRHAQLQTGCPHELRLIKIWQHYDRKIIQKYETVIHRYYNHKRIRKNGEWFELSKAELYELCQPETIEEQDKLIYEYEDLI